MAVKLDQLNSCKPCDPDDIIQGLVQKDAYRFNISPQELDQFVGLVRIDVSFGLLIEDKARVISAVSVNGDDIFEA